jgi:hypothetical protein
MENQKSIYNKLITVAVNGISSEKYRDQEILKSFCNLPIAELSEFWDGFTDATKLAIINAHQQEFVDWAKSTRANQNG